VADLAVSFSAVSDGEDFDGVREVVKAEAVVADAEPELGRVDALKAFYIVSLAKIPSGEQMVLNRRVGW